MFIDLLVGAAPETRETALAWNRGNLSPAPTAHTPNNNNLGTATSVSNFAETSSAYASMQDLSLNRSQLVSGKVLKETIVFGVAVKQPIVGDA